MRQTELGEFHEGFSSSKGPVSEYHGTVDMPAVMEEGIRGGPTTGRSKRYIPESLRGQEKISYTSPDRELALRFAQERAKKLGLPQSNVGVVGVRAGELSEPVRQAEPAGGVFAGTDSNVRAGGIPRQNLVPLTLKSNISISDPPLGVSMEAFTAAWNVLKATLPIKPETMQGATDPRRYRNYKQTGGVARRARERLMDETASMDADVDDEQLMGRKNPILDIYGDDTVYPPDAVPIEPLPEDMREYRIRRDGDAYFYGQE